MTRLEALKELAAKVEAGGTPEAHEITSAFRGWYHGEEPIVPYVRMACDAADIRAMGAANALHEAVLPGWTVCIGQNAHHADWSAWVRFAEGGAITHEYRVSLDCPARCWLLAILRALIAQEEAPHG